jgi:hypothetical protein
MGRLYFEEGKTVYYSILRQIRLPGSEKPNSFPLERRDVKRLVSIKMKGFEGSGIQVKGVEAETPAIPRRETFSIARQSRASESLNL